MTAGKARRGHRAQRAIGQHNLHRGAVIGIKDIVADPPARGLVEGGQTAGHLGHRQPGGEGREVEDMDPHIAQHTLRSMRLRQPPEPLALRVPGAPGILHQPALQIAGLEMPNGTDAPGPHKTRRLLQGGDIAIGQVDHVHHPGPGGQIGHLGGMGGAGGQRLFAQHMLARGKDGQGGGVMGGIGGDIGHGIELAPVQCLGQGGKAVGDAMGLPEGGQRLGAGVDPGHDLYPGNGGKVLGMVGGHAAGADDQQADRLRHVSDTLPRRRDAGAARVR